MKRRLIFGFVIVLLVVNVAIGAGIYLHAARPAERWSNEANWRATS